MRKQKLKKSLGFTLIELILVIAVLAIISAVGSRIVAKGLTGYIASQNMIDSDWQARIALESMTREIRNIRSVSNITIATPTRLTFVDTFGITIDYTLSGTNLMEGAQVLADGISTLSFTYYDNNYASTLIIANINVIQINMTVTQGNTNYPLQVFIFPRNKVT
jgi:prepilin-type N-terminal cleavage/methylation domain-containing protein